MNFSFIISVLFLVFVSSLSESNIHWIFLNYHKTGTDLTYNFAKHMFTNVSSCSGVIEKGNLNLQTQIKKIRGSNIAVARPMTYNLTTVLNLPPIHFRMVHFVREPCDMIMSGYLYHKQVPPPTYDESWLWEETSFNPCKYDSVEMTDRIIPQLSAFTNHKVDVGKLIDSVVYLCIKLRDQYVATNYIAVLNLAKTGEDLYNGIRLDACRALLDPLHGQVLHMAHNLLFEKEALLNLNSSLRIKRVYTSDFPVQDVSKFHRSTRELLDFLMSDSIEDRDAFYHCLGDRSHAVRRAMIASYAPLPSSYSEKSPYFARLKLSTPLGIPRELDARKHITADQMSKSERAMYIQRLESDPVLGELLLIVRKIVYDQQYP